MCGRFALSLTARLKEEFTLPTLPELAPRYNIAPSQQVAVVRFDRENSFRELRTMRWGLIPSWAKDCRIGYKMINARAETVHEKPAFQSAFKGRRCLIPAAGFYEWQKEAGRKQPYFIAMRDRRLFSFAGLWESWRDKSGGTIDSCTIITTVANKTVGRVHDRMPVILASESYVAWLDPAQSPDNLKALLKPYHDDGIFCYPVGMAVNNPRNDSADCIARIDGN